jgi:hypothetical protein
VIKEWKWKWIGHTLWRSQTHIVCHELDWKPQPASKASQPLEKDHQQWPESYQDIQGSGSGLAGSGWACPSLGKKATTLPKKVLILTMKLWKLALFAQIWLKTTPAILGRTLVIMDRSKHSCSSPGQAETVVKDWRGLSQVSEILTRITFSEFWTRAWNKTICYILPLWQGSPDIPGPTSPCFQTLLELSVGQEPSFEISWKNEQILRTVQ